MRRGPNPAYSQTNAFLKTAAAPLPVPAALPSPRSRPRAPRVLSRATAPNPLRARPLSPLHHWPLSVSVRHHPGPLGEAGTPPRPRRYRLGRAESK